MRQGVGREGGGGASGADEIWAPEANEREVRRDILKKRKGGRKGGRSTRIRKKGWEGGKEGGRIP